MPCPFPKVALFALHLAINVLVRCPAVSVFTRRLSIVVPSIGLTLEVLVNAALETYSRDNAKFLAIIVTMVAWVIALCCDSERLSMTLLAQKLVEQVIGFLEEQLFSIDLLRTTISSKWKRVLLRFIFHALLLLLVLLFFPSFLDTPGQDLAGIGLELYFYTLLDDVICRLETDQSPDAFPESMA